MDRNRSCACGPNAIARIDRILESLHDRNSRMFRRDPGQVQFESR